MKPDAPPPSNSQKQGKKKNGILNLYKPTGPTSFDMVRRVRWASGERRVGHGGTLDPLAEGVLLVGLGQGTRVLEFLSQSSKTYRAQIALGVATDTYDALGTPTPPMAGGNPHTVTISQIAEALKTFRGPILQLPPLYSAVKHQGKRLYQWARQGRQVGPLKPRAVEIYRLELLDAALSLDEGLPTIALEVECSRGTYIRSLAHDLGQALGCGAHLTALTRTQDGPFSLEGSVKVEEVEQAFRPSSEGWKDMVYPLDAVMLDWDAAILGPERQREVENGTPLRFSLTPTPRLVGDPARRDLSQGEKEDILSLSLQGRGNRVRVGDRFCRAYSLDGLLFAALRYQPADGRWHPHKVFSRT